jgi:phosphoribosylanthranilate isomerase
LWITGEGFDSLHPLQRNQPLIAIMDVKVKICGLTNVEDALAAVAAGADFLGFVLWERSPRHVTVESAREIARQLPPGTARVGVFVDATIEQVMLSLRVCDFSGLQFHGQETPAYCRQFGVMTTKAFRIRDAASLSALSAFDTDAFLLDSQVEGRPGGTGETFDWTLAAQAKKFDKPIFLAGGLTPQNVAAAVRAVRPFAVDVSTGVEVSPGKKDHQKMRDFVAAARAA